MHNSTHLPVVNVSYVMHFWSSFWLSLFAALVLSRRRKYVSKLIEKLGATFVKEIANSKLGAIFQKLALSTTVRIPQQPRAMRRWESSVSNSCITRKIVELKNRQPELYHVIADEAPDALKTGEIKNHFGRKVAIVSSKARSYTLDQR